ncbi:MAG: murein biosynthesis integral membrane protein MurJ [Acidimicrobiales bacterium]
MTDQAPDGPSTATPGPSPSADTAADASPGRGALVRSSALVAIGTGLSRVTGLVRVWALSYALAFTFLTDAYTIANTMPNLVYELLLGGVLSATLVPIFTERVKHDDGGTSAVVTVATLALVVVTAVGFVAAPAIFALYGSAITGASAAEVAAYRDVGTTLLRYLMPQVLFYGLITLVTAMLHARRSYLAPAYAPVLNNLVVSAMLFSLPTIMGRSLKGEGAVLDASGDSTLLIFLGVGTTVGVAAMALAMVPAFLRARPPIRFNPDFRHPAVRSLLTLSGWTVGYVVANQLTLSIVYYIAQSQDEGNVASYAVAFIFFQLPHGLLAVSLMTTFMPELTMAAQAGDEAAYRERFTTGVRLMALAVLPATFGYLALSLPVVDLLPIGAEAPTETTAGILAAFSIGLFGFSVYLFALRGFYARKNTKTPFLLNLCQNGMNLALALPLVMWGGVQGLALAYSVSYLAAAALALWALARATGGLGVRSMASSVVRMAIAGAACGAAAWAVSRALSETSSIVQVVIAVPAGAAVYVVLLLAMRVEEVTTARRLIAGRLRSRSGPGSDT